MSVIVSSFVVLNLNANRLFRLSIRFSALVVLFVLVDVCRKCSHVSRASQNVCFGFGVSLLRHVNRV